MENLRWILIFAGIAILVLLYLSGRQAKSGRRNAGGLNRDGAHGDGSLDPLLSDDAFGDPLADPLDKFGDNDGIDDLMERPGGQSPSQSRRSESGSEHSTGSLGGISSAFGSLGSKLAPKGRASEPESSHAPEQPPKIVTLHVVAPEGQLMHGEHLLEQFEQRGYHFGDMNIFHSLHEGQVVFSIAKLVKPGSFDIRDINSFQTPGISLILQLPGPVAADVAFEVLLSEAHEIANALGATVLDADRSTLSKQTVQHMREGINEYIYRQKYSSGVTS